MMKIGIIDNGINNSILDINREIEEYDFTHDNNFDNCSGDEPINHGTLCAAIIMKYAPEAELISLKVIQANNNKCDANSIIEAIKYCISNDIKIVNISLGSFEPMDAIMMSNIIEQAIKKDIIIVASGRRDKIVYPAGYSGVVYCDINRRYITMDNTYYQEYCPNGLKAMIASGRQELSIVSGKTFITPNYSSFATPVMTANIWNSLYLSSSPEVIDLQRYFATKSISKSSWR